MLIEPLDPVRHAVGCDAVVASLPYFFGQPAGLASRADAVRAQRGWVAMDDETVAGFLTVVQPFRESAEITWMAVHAHHRRRGIGRRLIDVAFGALASDGIEQLAVLTLGPSVDYPLMRKATTTMKARGASTSRRVSRRSSNCTFATGTTMPR